MTAEIEGCGCESEPHTCEDPAVADLERRLAEATAENERLRDLVGRAASMLEARSDRAARLEWARRVRLEAAPEPREMP